MKELTVENVNDIFTDCLFKDGEDDLKKVDAEGILYNYTLHLERLEKHKTKISEMLKCLPEVFNKGKGGGTSFLEACMTKDGNQWGEHSDMEKLFTLGIAVGLVEMLLPRQLWPILPGGMPYLVIIDEVDSNEESKV